MRDAIREGITGGVYGTLTGIAGVRCGVDTDWG